MPMLPSLPPDRFQAGAFCARAAAIGAVIRRNARDFDGCFDRAAFLMEMHRRGIPVAENAGQAVIFCPREPIRRVV